jgi:hypothetical protein
MVSAWFAAIVAANQLKVLHACRSYTDLPAIGDDSSRRIADETTMIREKKQRAGAGAGESSRHKRPGFVESQGTAWTTPGCRQLRP